MNGAVRIGAESGSFFRFANLPIPSLHRVSFVINSCNRLWVAALATAFVLPLSATAQERPPLEDRIGQMVIVSWTTAASRDTLLHDLTHRNLGGVLFFERQLPQRGLMPVLLDEFRYAGTTIPFLATDQEGGRVARLYSGNGFQNTWSASDLGSFFDEQTTGTQAGMMSDWLLEAGFNTNFAPVVDVNVNPSSPAIGGMGRSYSGNPARVTAHARAFLQASRSRGILTAIKHFPGHGSATADSHIGFTDITNTWQPYELHPFRDLIASGDVDMVMTGHLMNRNWDATYPATLSHYALTTILRDSLGYQGVIVSDEMFMGAISNNYSLDTAIVRAVQAGVDVLLFNRAQIRRNNVDSVSITGHIRRLLAEAVADGTISEARINASYDRIMALKMRLTTSTESEDEVPLATPLVSAYPNPFNPSTVIGYQVSVFGKTRLAVYDVLGREVAVLVDATLPAGEHEVRFDAAGLASGIYLVRLQTPSGVVTTPITLMR